MASSAEQRFKTRAQPLTALPQPFINCAAIAGEHFQCGLHCGQREGIAVQGPSVHNLSTCDQVHPFRLSCEHSAGLSRTDCFGIRCKIGSHAVETLRPGQVQTKPRDDFVKNQQGPVLPCDLAQRGQEPVRGGHDAHIAGDGLHDQRGNLVGVASECFLNRAWIVVGDADGLGRP